MKIFRILWRQKSRKQKYCVGEWKFTDFSTRILWPIQIECWSQWPRGLRRRSAAARLLGLWVRIRPGAWMSVSCDCCVLSGRGLCDGLITRPEESYRLWCVVECDLETSWMRYWPTGCCIKKKIRLNNLEVMGGGYIAVLADSRRMGDRPVGYLLTIHRIELLAVRV